MNHGSISEKLSIPPDTGLGAPEKLAPLFAADRPVTAAEWEKRRAELLALWNEVLGRPEFGEFDRRSEVIGSFTTPEFRATVVRQPTGPQARQLAVVLEPLQKSAQLRPGAVVPYYHPEVMMGFDLSGNELPHERPQVEFGRHLVRQGFVVVCTEAFPFNTVPQPEDATGFSWWRAAAEKLHQDHPRWSGIGKLTWDTRRAVDLLLEQPDVDAKRTLVIGHSLGGKMAFYAAAFDERLKAVIASDFGIGWRFTNWDAPWYLGPRIHQPEFVRAHHELLAFIAPRALLLLGGEADRAASWQYFIEARKVFRLFGREKALGFLHHASGHTPPPPAVETAYQWLAEQFQYEQP